MFFPASTIIAKHHPDLVGLIDTLDAHLHSLVDVPIRIDATADMLNVDPDTLARLFRIYEAEGTLTPVVLQLCPDDLDALQPDAEGGLWCEICETHFDADTCIEVDAYLVQQAPDRPASTPRDENRRGSVGPSGRLRTDRPERSELFSRQAAGQPQTASHRNNQRGHALIVGVGGYRDLPPLATTVRDAANLAEFFASPSGAGFAPANVGLLLEDQATRSGISLALEELARDTKPEDTIVFYFAGHGIRRLGGFEPGEYLCPIDTDSLNLRTTAIHADDLSTALRALPARQVVVLLDACYSGGMAAPPKTWEPTAFGLSEQAYSRLAGGSGRVVIASSKSDELSWELAALKRGLFTHYLIEGLRGGAADPDGAVRILDLYTYLSSHVPQHEKQHPVIKGELDSNFVIVPGNRPRSDH